MSQTRTALEIRPYTPADRDRVFDLYARAWPGDVERKKSGFRWIVEHNPFRDPELGYLLAFSGDVLTGYWGRMPVEFRVRGVPHRFVFHQEALVDPRFRRQGIARQLMEAATEPPELYLSLWHNMKVVSLLESAGWTSMDRYRPRRKIYRTRNLVRWKVGNRWLCSLVDPVARMILPGPPPPGVGDPSLATDEVDRFPPEVDRLFETIAPKVGFISDRSAGTLNWRYADIPHETFACFVTREADTGAVRGFVVLRIVHVEESGIRKGIVVDFLADPSDEAAQRHLVDAADRRFREEEVDFAVLLDSASLYGPVLEAWGFAEVRKPSPQSRLLYLDRRGRKEPAPESSYGDWALTYGESDAHFW